MKKTLTRIGLLTQCLALSLPLTANVLITEVVDGTLTGAAPKYIEITNVGATDYTFGTGGGIIIQSNAATDYIVDVDMTGVTIPAGASYTVSASNTNQNLDFLNVYGFAPDVLGGASAFANGDDRYAIADNAVDAAAGTLLDIFGEDGVDGTGTAWEYVDSCAYRITGLTSGNAGVFVLAEWVIYPLNTLEAPYNNGLDPLDPEYINDTSYDPFEVPLIRSFTTPGVYGVPSPEVPAGPAIAVQGDDIEVAFGSVYSLSYQLEISTDGMSSFSPAGTPAVSNGLPLTLTDAAAKPAAGDKVFYRVSVGY